AVSIRYNNLVYEMKSRGEDVIVLSLGEAFFDIPLFSFGDLPIPEGYHYSHSRGIPALRRRLAAYYGNHYRVPVDPEAELIVTAGSKIAIHMSLMAILSPGDEVLVLEPAWVSYTEQVKLCHATPVMVPHDRSIFQLGECLTRRTRAIIVNNPNNPSVKLLSREELEHLHDLADRHGLFLLSDEAYSEFVLDDSFLSCGVLDPEKKHTIVCNSMSKNYGMSGWRIGYVIGSRALIDEVLKINQHLVTCPATILQHYLERHFDEVLEITKPQIADVVRRRRELARFMDELGMSYLPGDSTFYFFVSIAPSGLSSDEFCTRLLTEHHVSTVPGIGYGASCDRFIRVSVGAESMDRSREGIRRVHRLIAETSAMPGPVVAGAAAG
ncbi:MAG TPA: aminotransferase class I/II-fold pyridoxal phosphate-dependent enzyme, partial [Longimicrobiaceae bacterium]|nr:aminotransferase class I/II-fold pyridoxal phosphate-dependent enzyme [Longimicrobiaceae bacterium]